MGGKHRASSYLDGHLAQAEEVFVSWKREAYAVRDEIVAAVDRG